MRRLAATALCLLAGAGCATRAPSPAKEGARPGGACRYLSVLVDYSTQANGMSLRDVRLSAQVAEVMQKELRRLGAEVTDDPGEAYWSLMLMAIHNERDEGFIFSAMLGLRGLGESRDPGIAAYAKSKQDAGTPTLYTGISYGSLQDVDRLAREYVRQADAALLPTARELCVFEAADAKRQQDVDFGVPRTERPL